MRLVLFDIDGTLLRSDGAGRRALNAALLDVFGAAGPADHWLDGKTDRQIVRELMRSEGIADAAVDERMEQVLERYLVHLDVELARPEFSPSVYEGVYDLLSAVESTDTLVMGLLTGNVEQGAFAKLRSVGLKPERFRVGAFGSDHEHRAELPAIARRRALGVLGVELAGSAIVVIGDTPADVACGRSIGARSIAVATGRYGEDELRTHSPHAVFRDFSDTDRVLDAILTV